MRGETFISPLALTSNSYFNPLTPCGVRQRPVLRRVFYYNFNPLTPCGVRRRNRANGNARNHFNPLTPCGVRLYRSRWYCIRYRFQSTHPMRGETILIIIVLLIRLFQSTHPMRGETVYWDTPLGFYSDFNPLTPCGVRRPTILLLWLSRLFQSTHPMRGETSRAVASYGTYNFNPLTPCGVRL